MHNTVDTAEEKDRKDLFSFTKANDLPQDQKKAEPLLLDVLVPGQLNSAHMQLAGQLQSPGKQNRAAVWDVDNYLPIFSSLSVPVELAIESANH